ncbi:MAG: hypothetical protein QM621_15065 [Aeromicrobium sp.]|uniref:hypothetical protein n=1 Tax=Aeromicrobium sp. TaxID=1871063 RepID=UPI0039E65070
MTDFAICLTCRELTTGRIDSSKGWLLDASSNHDRCDVRPFTNPATLPAPIRNAIVRLGASVPVADTHARLATLAFHLEDQWPLAPLQSPSTAPAAVSTSTRSAAPAAASAASTRSQPASPPTPTTRAPADGQLDLFGDLAS